MKKTFLGAELLRRVPALFPGVALSVAIMLVSLWLADWLGRGLLNLQGIAGKTSPFPGVSIAILLGILTANLLKLPPVFTNGIRFCVATVLRLGIILIGIKLSVLDVLKLGIWGIPVVLAAITAGLVFVNWFNRLLGLPARLGTLIATGTGICGITAIVSVAPVIQAEEKEVAYAVANITLFGLLGMLVYPYLAPHLLKTPEQIGLFLGTAVHDTSQVVGAALTCKELLQNDLVLKAATVTKLTRNLFLAAVVPLTAYLYSHRQGQTPVSNGIKMAKFFPVFILGFLAMAVLRSLGDWMAQTGPAFGIWSPSGWEGLTKNIGEVCGSRYLLGTALAAVGLNTTFSVFRGVGAKPFAVGFAGAVFVGAVGLVMALLLGRFVHL